MAKSTTGIERREGGREKRKGEEISNGILNKKKMKPFSTFSVVLDEISQKSKPFSFANALPSSVDTCKETIFFFRKRDGGKITEEKRREKKREEGGKEENRRDKEEKPLFFSPNHTCSQLKQ